MAFFKKVICVESCVCYTCYSHGLLQPAIQENLVGLNGVKWCGVVWVRVKCTSVLIYEKR